LHHQHGARETICGGALLKTSCKYPDEVNCASVFETAVMLFGAVLREEWTRDLNSEPQGKYESCH
jgi:hypothetical protein